MYLKNILSLIPVPGSAYVFHYPVWKILLTISHWVNFAYNTALMSKYLDWWHGQYGEKNKFQYHEGKKT